jgi:hypothetical protein
MLCARVHEDARRAVSALASEHCMSLSEYLARLLNDHLGQVIRARGGIPAAIPNYRCR